jgi:hypothetical protein
MRRCGRRAHYPRESSHSNVDKFSDLGQSKERLLPSALLASDRSVRAVHLGGRKVERPTETKVGQ